jgi:hypothetical protein
MEPGDASAPAPAQCARAGAGALLRPAARGPRSGRRPGPRCRAVERGDAQAAPACWRVERDDHRALALLERSAPEPESGASGSHQLHETARKVPGGEPRARSIARRAPYESPSWMRSGRSRRRSMRRRLPLLLERAEHLMAPGAPGCGPIISVGRSPDAPRAPGPGRRGRRRQRRACWCGWAGGADEPRSSRRASSWRRRLRRDAEAQSCRTRARGRLGAIPGPGRPLAELAVALIRLELRPDAAGGTPRARAWRVPARASRTGRRARRALTHLNDPSGSPRRAAWNARRCLRALRPASRRPLRLLWPPPIARRGDGGVAEAPLADEPAHAGAGACGAVRGRHGRRQTAPRPRERPLPLPRPGTQVAPRPEGPAPWDMAGRSRGAPRSARDARARARPPPPPLPRPRPTRSTSPLRRS